MQEERALAKARRGDPGAFERLAAPYERRLYALCLRMMGRPEDAQDVLQETMLRLWRGLEGFGQRAQFGTWAYRVATNVCLDALRKRNLRGAASLDVLTEEGFSPADPSPAPEEALIARARAEAVAAALEALPPEARAALVLRDMQGESYESVAETLGLALGTVKSRIYRAREKMAALLAREPELFEAERVQGREGRRS